VSAWLQNFPAGATRENAVNSLVSQLSYSDPKTAATWAQTMADEKQRNSRMENIARNWLRQDQTAAMNWINQSTLPDQTKQRLLKNAAVEQ
jgi:hypothetical protein